ncbi:Arc family DNA-binding protein [Rhizobium sp. BK602]|uniref:Arc family DNA-binding protein n=1 Tax=Rhizobium sp. BK602 TaxID=2586986 RepID=UPI001607B64F|nr:Arc family DNA-binding protein [Rhizobium sp. BK602]MBB3610983.1 tetrahydromethanopterin S-methyltransferase subunit G [Rhizobium sp. BK602]
MARGDFPSAKQDQFMLRFPDGMRDRLKEAAENHGRSMNAEIVAILEEHPRLVTLPMDVSYLKMENARLRAEIDEARISRDKALADNAALRHLLNENHDAAVADEETISVIEKRFSELKDQIEYLEKLKSELLALAKPSDEPVISDTPLSSELFDKLFGDMRDRLDRIERKVDGRSDPESSK